MVEPKHSITSRRILVFSWTESLQEDAVVGLDYQGVSQSLLTDDFSKNGHVILPSTVKIEHSLLAETSGPNGERIALIILFIGILEDVLNVGCPLIVPINRHLTSGEEDSVDLAQNIVELSLRVMIVKRKYLCASHFEVLHIASTDIGLTRLERLTEVLCIFSIHPNDRVLRRKCENCHQEQRKDKREYLHQRRINNYSYPVNACISVVNQREKMKQSGKVLRFTGVGS